MWKVNRSQCRSMHIFSILQKGPEASTSFCGLMKHPLRKHLKSEFPSADIRVCQNMTYQKESMNCSTEVNISWKWRLAFWVHRLRPRSRWGLSHLWFADGQIQTQKRCNSSTVTNYSYARKRESDPSFLTVLFSNYFFTDGQQHLQAWNVIWTKWKELPTQPKGSGAGG